VIATKFGYPTTQGPNEQGQSRKWIIQSVEASLKRLGTDYIDIIYFHRALADAPLEEGVRAIADLIRQGKIRYFGVSNFRGWRIAEIARLADQLGIDRPVASEPLYNIVDRTAEVEQLPAAAHYGVGVVSYSPLARGVLSGKYAVDAPRGPTRAQAAATGGSSRPNGGRSHSGSRKRSRLMRSGAARLRSPSRSPGCSTTGSSARPSRVRGPKHSWTAMSKR
jgi:aryl-alcohol dehydrogenase-like predicted oxidoreductase